MVPKHHRREQQAKQPEAVVVGRKPVGGIRKCRRIRDAGGLWRPSTSAASNRSGTVTGISDFIAPPQLRSAYPAQARSHALEYLLILY